MSLDMLESSTYQNQEYKGGLLMDFKDVVIRVLTEKIAGLEQLAYNQEQEIARLNQELAEANTVSE